MKTHSLLSLATVASLCSLMIVPAVGEPATQTADAPATRPASTPAVGNKATDFSLKTLQDKTVTLSEVTTQGPAVVVVLRGWPGYQCPICTRQVGDLIQRTKDFEAEKARVILVYPGPADGLKAHAEEFAIDQSLPANFTFVIDPDYAFTNAWNLRWNAAGETAYPSSFVIDKTGVVRYAKVSKSHGGRASTPELLNALKASR